jgi:alkanesulfonate monooxygenase SsuD/methylene tetrahydromethanopterin reductase-like flavin-dependent oxidoreductase (luciferase family)
VLTRPIQERLPIMIGGGGERRTLRTTARYADMWHGFGTPEQVAHKVEVLRKHCADVGRDPSEITPFAGKWVVIRENPAEAKKVLERIARTHGMTSPPEPFVGGAEQIAERIAEYWRVGIRGFIVAFAEPFDTESIERLGRDVRPRLRELVSRTPAPVSG